MKHPVQLTAAYHDACHLRHAQGVYQQPRDLLAGIPGLEVAEIAESSLCCGSAGVYNLLQPEPAQELGDRKVEHLLATQAAAVVSAKLGQGRVVLIGFPAQHRAQTHATYKLLFNSLVH